MCCDSDARRIDQRYHKKAGKVPNEMKGAISALVEIENAIRGLSPEEKAAFRAWYAEFDAAEWDRQLEEDVATGKLDWLIDEAREDLRAGRCTDR
jgi:hypothetical protein